MIFYLSFVGEDGWLGAVLIESQSIESAYFKVTIKKLNPGGEVAIAQMPEEEEWRTKDYLGRLLTKDDIDAMDALEKES